MVLIILSVNFYCCICFYFWSGVFCIWGLDNWEVVVRVLSNFVFFFFIYFELKIVDVFVNFYLVLGSVIVVGLDGINCGFDVGEFVLVDFGNMM